MTLGAFLAAATAALTQAGIETARLDALILLEDELARDRASLLAHPEIVLSLEQQAALNAKVDQRTAHIPLAYIRGKAAFYGRDFLVTPKVLVPRPESEAIIDLLKKANPSPVAEPLRVADVGTGSGCLGITAALEIPNSIVDLYDIDSDALAVARANAKRHSVKAHYYKEDLLAEAFSAGRPHYDVLLANLPYVPTNYPINRAARAEPPQALFAGDDGLELYRRFWKTASTATAKPGVILTESLPSQHVPLAALAANAGYTLRGTDGLVQHFVTN